MSLFWSMAAMLGNSAVVVVVCTRPRAIPLAKITMRKSTHGFLLSFPCMMSMGLRLAALRAAGAPLLYGFRENFSRGKRRVVPSRQDSSILPAPVANHSAGSDSSCQPRFIFICHNLVVLVHFVEILQLFS